MLSPYEWKEHWNWLTSRENGVRENTEIDRNGREKKTRGVINKMVYGYQSFTFSEEEKCHINILFQYSMALLTQWNWYDLSDKSQRLRALWHELETRWQRSPTWCVLYACKIRKFASYEVNSAATHSNTCKIDYIWYVESDKKNLQKPASREYKEKK